MTAFRSPSQSGAITLIAPLTNKNLFPFHTHDTPHTLSKRRKVIDLDYAHLHLTLPYHLLIQTRRLNHKIKLPIHRHFPYDPLQQTPYSNSANDSSSIHTKTLQGALPITRIPPSQHSTHSQYSSCFPSASPFCRNTRLM